MDKLPDKPAGSVIVEEADSEGITLRWPVPSPGIARYAYAAFIAFWLCGWAVGWIAAAAAIIAGGGPQLFLVGWLGAWTLGGGFVIWALWSMLRPAHPESVRLEVAWLRYDPGRSPMNPLQYGGWWHWGGAPAAPSSRRPVQVPRAEIGGFALECVGERQRLCFDRGADRVEIGACLREPEREWLYAILQRWLAPTHEL
jgi:hypothetical protein